MNKSRHFKKTQNELKVLSPSPALVQRHEKEGPAQTAPGLGKSRRQTRFNFFFCHIITGDTYRGQGILKK